MHPLKTYLKKKKESPNGFAKRAGLNQPTVWRIINGKQVPRPKTAELIELATNGEITRFQLLYPRQSGA